VDKLEPVGTHKRRLYMVDNLGMARGPGKYKPDKHMELGPGRLDSLDNFLDHMLFDRLQ
jgi:hypothetical protein